MELNRKLAVRREFDDMINMTPDEMRVHFSTSESDMVSLDPKLAAKLKKSSGRTLGKKALVLKEKQDWEETDYDEAANLVRPLRFQLGRKVALQTSEGAATPFCHALMNRGHDPRRMGRTVAVAEAEIPLDRVRNGIEETVRRFVKLVLGANERDYDGPYPWVKEVFLQSGFAIVELEGTYFRVGFSFTGDPFDSESEMMLLPAWEEVVQQYVPAVQTPDAPPGEMLGEVMEVGEAEADAAPVWKIVMIRAGDAKNKAENGVSRNYPASVLKQGVEEGLFNNIPGKQRTDAEHTKRTDAEDCGVTGVAEWSETEQAVLNTFTWDKAKYPALIHAALKKAISEGDTKNIPGFSITADVYTYKFAPHIVAKLEKVHSCDPVSFPSAGGAVTHVSESHSTNTENSPMNEQQKAELLAALTGANITSAADLRTALTKTSVSEGDAVAYMIAVLQEKAPELFEGDDKMDQVLTKNETMAVKLFKLHMKATTGDAGPSAAAPEEKAAVSEAVNELDGLLLDTAVEKSGLDEIQRTQLRKRFTGQRFVRTQVEEAIRDAKDIQAAYDRQDPARIRVIRPSEDKLQTAFNDFFMQDVPGSTDRKSVSESYGFTLSPTTRGGIFSMRELAEMAVGHHINWLDRQQVSEAMDTVVAAKVLANGMNLRVAYQFNMPTEYNDFRRITNIVPVPDYKTKTALVFGSLSGWGARDNTNGYPALTSSGATAQTYTPSDQGGLFTISKQHFINDDVAYFQSIPQQIADIGIYAMSSLVWVDLIGNNPTLTDGYAAFDATNRGNLISGELDESGLALRNAIKAFQAQAFPGDANRKLISRPRFLGISMDPAQQQVAYNSTVAASGQSNAVATWLQSRGLVPITNPHTEDYNDFYLFAERGVVEMGVYGNQIEPLVSIADSPTEGRRFTHDEIIVKGDHAYGANWVSPLNAVKSENVGEG